MTKIRITYRKQGGRLVPFVDRGSGFIKSHTRDVLGHGLYSQPIGGSVSTKLSQDMKALSVSDSKETSRMKKLKALHELFTKGQ
jgi:hypothetical protein